MPCENDSPLAIPLWLKTTPRWPLCDPVEICGWSLVVSQTMPWIPFGTMPPGAKLAMENRSKLGWFTCWTWSWNPLMEPIEEKLLEIPKCWPKNHDQEKTLPAFQTGFRERQLSGFKMFQRLLWWASCQPVAANSLQGVCSSTRCGSSMSRLQAIWTTRLAHVPGRSRDLCLGQCEVRDWSEMDPTKGKPFHNTS